MTNYRTQKVEKETIRYLHQGSGEPLVFLHGFGFRPSYYLPLLNLLAEHFETISPAMYGINYLNGQPVTIDEYADLTLSFCSSLKVDYHCVAGHSLGGTVAFKIGDTVSKQFHLIGINPVLPVDYGILGFALRALYKNIREALGITGGMRAVLFGNTILLSSLFNLLKDKDSSIDIVSDIRSFTYHTMQVTQSTLIFYGERDEFFTLDEKTTRQIKGAFKKAAIKRLGKMNHDWLIFYPELAVREISDFVKH